jgi:hypothetical protein
VGDAAPPVGRGPRALPPAPAWTAAFLPPIRGLDRAAERFQRRRFPADIAATANRDTRVVVTRDVLKFHVNDRRAAYERAFRERLAALERSQAVPA